MRDSRTDLLRGLYIGVKVEDRGSRMLEGIYPIYRQCRAKDVLESSEDLNPSAGSLNSAVSAIDAVKVGGERRENTIGIARHCPSQR
jgi:hypothetical protein